MKQAFDLFQNSKFSYSVQKQTDYAKKELDGILNIGAPANLH